MAEYSQLAVKLNHKLELNWRVHDLQSVPMALLKDEGAINHGGDTILLNPGALFQLSIAVNQNGKLGWDI